MTTTTDIPRPRFARMYLKAAARADRRGATEHRRRLLQDLTGRVLEMGAGNGLNFAHYPPTVTEVVAIEPEPTLRAIAQQAAAGAPVPVTVRAGTADALPLEDGEMDAAVASLVLCSVPDQARALAELHRVLRPGAELRFYEHVIARCQPMRTILRLADHSGLWPRDRRRLPPRARHRRRHRGRRLHDRALRALRLSRQRAGAQRPAHPRHRTTALGGGRRPALDRGLAKLGELFVPQQVIYMGEGGVQTLEAAIGCTLEGGLRTAVLHHVLGLDSAQGRPRPRPAKGCSSPRRSAEGDLAGLLRVSSKAQTRLSAPSRADMAWGRTREQWVFAIAGIASANSPVRSDPVRPCVAGSTGATARRSSVHQLSTGRPNSARGPD